MAAGIFGKILEKLGFSKEVTTAAVASAAAAAKHAARDDYPTAGGTGAGRQVGVPAAATPVPITPVDVVKNLEGLAAKNPQKLDWKVSIVDLLKLLGIDSSLQARKDLAVELGCPADKMKDSAAMNTWLHKEVLRKLALNGGNVPKELLD
jgi:hypothetical protein